MLRYIRNTIIDQQACSSSPDEVADAILHLLKYWNVEPPAYYIQNEVDKKYNIMTPVREWEPEDEAK